MQSYEKTPITHPVRKRRNSQSWKETTRRREQTCHVVEYYMVPFSMWANEPTITDMDDDPRCHVTVKRYIA